MGSLMVGEVLLSYTTVSALMVSRQSQKVTERSQMVTHAECKFCSAPLRLVQRSNTSSIMSTNYYIGYL